ncbi:sigma54 specific transcriptional regulator [Thermacetogenium phaeum DSM 12270]|uniref:Sigma54 specific transcriptional regulator n=1 Tax=Thermacetogenium phaeum (strain ATCC BAA-254 / DSM 26808 / PB) TaxID=1089553 RepID=K4LWI6_THEPS|nr:sigma-54-dependent Fis family transcriptional regulator [Thermacetogenium phaeum]AFV12354.1 sigma54 specific transcriptional regulator [Thermacetogenium phaeum DSM 12270]
MPNNGTVSRSIAIAWKIFVNTGKIPATVRSEIAESWLRSRRAGVDPWDGVSHRVLSAEQLEALLYKKRSLIDVARPFMTNLYHFVAGSGFIVLLSDEQGFIMEVMGDSDILKNAAELNLIRGASWIEEETGTNGLGTALAIRRPIQVSGEEHYCQKVHGWTCSAAPIYDDDGRVIGALQMSGPSFKTHPHTLGMVVAAVEAIRSQLRLQRRNSELVLLNNRLGNIFHTVSDGVVVVDRNGLIEQVNPAAEKILSKPDSEIRGAMFKEFVERDPGIEELLTTGKSYTDKEVIVNNRTGIVYCLSSGKPIQDEKGAITDGVIFLNPINKIRNLVNRLSGAQATYTFADIIGRNKKLLKAVQLAKLAATNDSNVLLQGESGTGKEVFAQAIHNASSRRNGPFIAVNCGAIPRELIGSELFGYDEGAFTGARRGGRPGKFELASGGTLFLDEIGDMPLEHQVALLRVLQDKRITRIGGEKVIAVDVRVICATNKDLKLEVARGNFREDLFYRLNVISISLPPLRERREDIPLLFDVFFEEICKKMHVDIRDVDPRVIPCLQRYHWPGNIREFQNVIERMVNVAAGQSIRLEHLPEEIVCPHSSGLQPEGDGAPRETTLLAERNRIKRLLAEKERQEISLLLVKNKGNLSKVARELGISRSSLYRKLRKLDILSKGD